MREPAYYNVSLCSLCHLYVDVIAHFQFPKINQCHCFNWPVLQYVIIVQGLKCSFHARFHESFHIEYFYEIYS